jgi:hypothetical protein
LPQACGVSFSPFPTPNPGLLAQAALAISPPQFSVLSPKNKGSPDFLKIQVLLKITDIRDKEKLEMGKNVILILAAVLWLAGCASLWTPAPSAMAAYG